MHDTASEAILLTGLDGSNPLAFLAALGTLRCLTLAWPDRNVRMAWTQHAGAWRPRLAAHGLHDPNHLIDALWEVLMPGPNPAQRHQHLNLGKNLSVSPSLFRSHASQAAKAAHKNDRRWADFVASFGSEILKNPNEKTDRIHYTELCFISGSGNQNYLETIKKLLEQIKKEHLRQALFEPWLYRDETLSMRWDPAERREYAYQWNAPADEPAFTVWGANILAFEGTVFYPVIPTFRVQPTTTGFRRGNDESPRVIRFIWPIWNIFLSENVVRSLLAASELRSPTLAGSLLRQLRQRGIVAIFSAEKIKVGEGRNFKWNFASPEHA